MMVTFSSTYLHPYKAYPEQATEDIKVSADQPVEVTAGPLCGMRGKVYRFAGLDAGLDLWAVELEPEEVLDRMRQHVVRELTNVLGHEDTKYVLSEVLARLNR